MAFEIEDHVLIKYIPEPNETKVIVPEGITEIKTFAFGSCSNLKEVILPEGLIKMGRDVFSSCRSLEKIIIPDSVIMMHTRTFMDCDALEKITLPKNLQIIKSDLFLCCKHLKEIDIPDGVTKIESGAFHDCIRLKQVHLPESVRYVGEQAFSGTAWLRTQQKKNALVIAGNVLIKAKPVNGVVIVPDTVKTIAQCAFYNDPKLEKLVIPPHILNLDGAIIGCRNLKTITCEGFTFSANPNKTYLFIRMLSQRDFSPRMALNIKYRFLWELFDSRQDDPELNAYIKKHFLKMCQFLIDENQISVMKKLFSIGWIHKRNIDKLISYAIDHQKTEMQILLMDYKNTHIGYDDTGTIIKKKFAL